MDKTYRVGLIGCGGQGRAHVTGVQADPRLQVVALADPNREAADKFNTDYGFNAPVYTDYQELLEKAKPDIAVACLWTPLHLPVYRDCAQAGVKAVLSEKPMAPTWGDCLEMARIAEQTGCQLTFSHQRRFAKGNILVRQLIADGVFGEIKRLDLYSPPNLLDCGTHTVDQALSFINETPARWVLGAADTSEVLNWFNVRSECMAEGTIVFQNGVRAHLQIGGPDMDMWGGVRVIGSEGFIEVFWDGNYGQAAVYKQPDWKPPVIEEKSDEHMVGLVRNAVDCLQSGQEPEASYQKALRASEILFALYESVRRRARVELPLTDVLDNPLHALLDAETNN
ncbi:MAG: Gfo/Idh/MocA family oxidoreductase [Abitibacteriaceae bacterium]|nr:Gfo/Idh/MocA family oxidoreductase [Abditibacteriaceae bacterium]